MRKTRKAARPIGAVQTGSVDVEIAAAVVVAVVDAADSMAVAVVGRTADGVAVVVAVVAVAVGVVVSFRVASVLRPFQCPFSERFRCRPPKT